MTFLFPLGLIGLGSLPVLFWLWRLSATHRQIKVPSLVPFEHLLKRQARRKTRLVVNLLFWLQLAALIGLTLALSQPLLPSHRARRILAILDTSASMDARLRGPSAFEQAQQQLLSRLTRKRPADQVLLVASAPVTAVTSMPTSDLATLTRAVRGLKTSHLGGNLATSVRIGQALLGADPDETLVVTDEPLPSESLGDRVRWMSVGKPLPNVAIVGVDAQGPLCAPTEARVVATIQNFSNAASTISLAAMQDGRRLAKTSAELAPHARQLFSLELPAGTQGWLDMTLTAPHDALAVDNHAWVQLREHAKLPVVIRSQTPSFTRTLSTWLGACQALTWTTQTPSVRGSYVVVTDHDEAMASATAALLFLPPSSPAPIRSHWVTSFDHPISSYLAPVELVTASLNLLAGQALLGTPVISALVQGRKVPVVVADDQQGRRTVSILLDPAGSEDTTPVLLAFFNSLRWVSGHSEVATTGEPVTAEGMAPGAVRVRRPDGAIDFVEAQGGTLRYETTTVAGRYRFVQGPVEVVAAVNFVDPLESDTLAHPSTWGGFQSLPVAATRGSSRAVYPLSNLLLLLICVLLVIEWWLYCTKGTFRARV